MFAVQIARDPRRNECPHGLPADRECLQRTVEVVAFGSTMYV